MSAGEGAHILVVEDDSRLRRLLQRYLTENGFRVTAVPDIDIARRHLKMMLFDLVVLDRMMPGGDGIELAQMLRGDSEVPILMLTAMVESEHRIEGLKAGVDDYLPKPFEPLELLLRIRTILRRVEETPEPPAQLRLGALWFDPGRRLLLRDGDPVRLTETEINLLVALSHRPGQVFSRTALTWLCSVTGGERAIDVQVSRLRGKIEPDPAHPRFLRTVRNRGYALQPDEVLNSEGAGC